MRVLRSILLVFLFTLSFVAKGAEIIGIEVKEYDNLDAYVFYHPDYFNLEVSYINGRVKLKSDYPIKFRKLTPVSIASMTSNLKNENSKTISFNTIQKYKSYEIVKGEKLTAIKFKTDKVFNKVPYKVNALNKLENTTSPGLEHEIQRSQGKKEAKIRKIKNAIEIKFEFNQPVAAAAFMRGNKLWVGFDKKESFYFPIIGDIKPPSLVDVDNATVLSVDIPPHLNPSMRLVDNTWILTLKEEAVPVKHQIKVEKLVDHYGVHLINDHLKNAITFRDTEVGDLITLITTRKHSIALTETRVFTDFTLYNSILGAGIIWLVDNFNTTFSKAGAEIFSTNNAVFAEKNEEVTPEIVDYTLTALPFSFGQDSKYDFVKKRAILYRQLALADSTKIEEAKYNLAKFFFAELLFPETLGVLNLINFESDYIKKLPEASFLRAVIFSIVGRYNDSNNLLKAYLLSNLNEGFKAEVKLWYSYNNYKINKGSTVPLGIIKYLDGFLNKYEDALYWPIVFAEFDIASSNNDYDLIESLFKKIRAPTDIFAEDTLNYYKATFYRKNDKLNIANNYYDSIKLNLNDPKNYVRAEFDQVEIALRAKEITIKDAVDRLEKLKFLWRGDELEYKILIKIAELQGALEQYIPSLRTYKYILTAFPDSQAAIYITNQMANIFSNKIFSPDGVAFSLDDFSLVALFHEFRELTPIGEAGDKIVLAVAKRLINLDLFDEAQQILNHQIKYRLEGQQKVISGEHLAVVYIMDKKPKQAVEVLDDTDLFNYKFLEHISRQRIKAKAYIDIGNYEAALEIVRDDESIEGKNLKEEVYFMMADWQNYAIIAESTILPTISVGKTLAKSNEKEALRLAIAYSMLNKNEDLQMLTVKLKTSNPNLETAIKFIATTNNPIDVKNIDSKFNVSQVEEDFKSIVNKLFDFK